LAAIAPTRRCDRLAEMSALFHAAGTVHLRGRGQLAFHLDLASNAIARRAFALLRELRVDSEVRTYERRAFAGETRYQLHVEGEEHALGVLVEAGVLGAERLPLDRPPGWVVARACCRAAYLRGAFLGGGSLSGPRSPHLELRSPTHAGAAFVRAVASTEGVRLRVIDRAGHAAAYAKSREAVEGFLALAGVRAEANRLANADHANLVRQSRAAEAQLEAAALLRRAGELERLPDHVREAAELRLRNPTLSLRELASRAAPPVTKATMQRRLSAVLRAAETG
jgi:DNA-binding transcriptional regulator WhiA